MTGYNVLRIPLPGFNSTINPVWWFRLSRSWPVPIQEWKL